MDTEIARSTQLLTPRQDRLEGAIVNVLRTRGTRSSLRVLVDEFADHSRVQGTSLDNALLSMETLAMRAGPELAVQGDGVGESISDRIAMMTRWLQSRYIRAD